VLSVRGGIVSAIDGFIGPSMFASLGLPERL
jgi:hypothetical protein